VPVVGYQTDEFPAFFSRESGLPVTVSVDGPREAAAVAREQWNMGIHSAVLVVVPPPADSALPREQVEESIAQALSEAESAGVHGPAVTPYLLKRVTELSGGASLRANLALLRNNARVAAQIANELYTRLDLKHI
jgi:pseudouridine-5'-phosphate glycosidase